MIQRMKDSVRRWIEGVVLDCMSSTIDDLTARIQRVEHTLHGQGMPSAKCWEDGLGSGSDIRCTTCKVHSHPCPCRRCLARVYDGSSSPGGHLCPACQQRGCT